MKSLLLLSIICFGSSILNIPGRNIINNSVIPIANAGPDQTIYLTQASTATLDGSLSIGDSYQWTDISTDYKSGAVISSPSSTITTVTGLVQGTWYYQLAVTSGEVVAKDTVIVRVDYDVPPENSVLLRHVPIEDPGFSKMANIRDDTTSYWATKPDPGNLHNSYDYNEGVVFFQRDRTNGIHVDSESAKLYTTVEDGYAGETGTHGRYARSELHFGSTYGIDSNKTYVFEWKGYYLQSLRSNMPRTFGIYPNDQFSCFLSMMQWHGKDDLSGPYLVRSMYDSIQFLENSASGNGSNAVTNLMVCTDANVMKTHTIRVTMKEGMGYPGQKAFIKVELDGVQKYYRNNGNVGQTWQKDYPKFSGIYDYQRVLVNPDSLARGEKFSLVTEAYRIYLLQEHK